MGLERGWGPCCLLVTKQEENQEISLQNQWGTEKGNGKKNSAEAGKKHRHWPRPVGKGKKLTSRGEKTTSGVRHKRKAREEKSFPYTARFWVQPEGPVLRARGGGGVGGLWGGGGGGGVGGGGGGRGGWGGGGLGGVWRLSKIRTKDMGGSRGLGESLEHIF